QEQTLGPLFVEILVVDADGGLAFDRTAKHAVPGMAILVLVPLQHARELTAIMTEPASRGALALIDAEALGSGIIADVTGLDNDKVLAVIGVGTMAIDRNIAADPAVVERKGTEMLGDQDNRVALAFVGTKSAPWHHPLTFEAE